MIADIRNSLAARGLIRDVSPQSRILDAVVAGIGFLITVMFEIAALGYTASDVHVVWVALVGLVLWGAFAIARWSPALALAAAWVGALLQMAVLLPPIGPDIAIFVIVYATAAWGTRQVMWAGLISSFVGAIFIGLYLYFSGAGGGFPPEPQRDRAVSAFSAAFILIIFLLAWALGLVWRAYRRSEERHIQARTADARAAEEAERVAIARDMHDVVAHSLAVVLAQANGARYIADHDPEATKLALSTISQTAGDALKDVRLLLAQLRHRQGELPQPMLSDIDTLFERVRATGRDLTVEAEGDLTAIPAAVQLASYRVLQEAISNALRHGVGPISVGLGADRNRLELSVSNPVAPGQAEPGRTGAIAAARGVGHGIIGMRERVALVGGDVRAQQVGSVFVVYAQFPLAQQGAR